MPNGEIHPVCCLLLSREKEASLTEYLADEFEVLARKRSPHDNAPSHHPPTALTSAPHADGDSIDESEGGRARGGRD